jgi:hypothetical protein
MRLSSSNMAVNPKQYRYQSQEASKSRPLLPAVYHRIENPQEWGLIDSLLNRLLYAIALSDLSFSTLSAGAMGMSLANEPAITPPQSAEFWLKATCYFHLSNPDLPSFC